MFISTRSFLGGEAVGGVFAICNATVVARMHGILVNADMQYPLVFEAVDNSG